MTVNLTLFSKKGLYLIGIFMTFLWVSMGQNRVFEKWVILIGIFVHILWVSMAIFGVLAKNPSKTPKKPIWGPLRTLFSSGVYWLWKGGTWRGLVSVWRGKETFGLARSPEITDFAPQNPPKWPKMAILGVFGGPFWGVLRRPVLRRPPPLEPEVALEGRCPEKPEKPKGGNRGESWKRKEEKYSSERGVDLQLHVRK